MDPKVSTWPCEKCRRQMRRVKWRTMHRGTIFSNHPRKKLKSRLNVKRVYINFMECKNCGNRTIIGSGINSYNNRKKTENLEQFFVNYGSDHETTVKKAKQWLK